MTHAEPNHAYVNVCLAHPTQCCSVMPVCHDSVVSSSTHFVDVHPHLAVFSHFFRCYTFRCTEGQCHQIACPLRGSVCSLLTTIPLQPIRCSGPTLDYLYRGAGWHIDWGIVLYGCDDLNAWAYGHLTTHALIVRARTTVS